MSKWTCARRGSPQLSEVSHTISCVQVSLKSPPQTGAVSSPDNLRQNLSLSLMKFGVLLDFGYRGWPVSQEIGHCGRFLGAAQPSTPANLAAGHGGLLRDVHVRMKVPAPLPLVSCLPTSSSNSMLAAQLSPLTRPHSLNSC